MARNFYTCKIFLLLFAQLTVGQPQGCVLRFDVQSDSSPLILNGQSIAPVPGVPITAVSNPKLAGSFYISLAGVTSCPAQPTVSSFDGAAFVSSQALNLSPTAPPSLIFLSPSVVQTRAGVTLSFANVTFYDIEVSVQSPAISVDAQTGAFSVQQTWTVASGLSEERSILSSLFTFRDLANTPSTVAASGTFSISGQEATLSFPTLTWPLVLLGAENEKASYTFQGALEAHSVLGCPNSCSFRGQCTIQASVPTCVCDCSFQGSDCSQVSLSPLALEAATSAFPSTPTDVIDDGNIHLQLVGPGLGDFAANSSLNASALVGNASCGPLSRISTSVATCTLAPQPDALDTRAPVQVVRGCQHTQRTLTSLVSVVTPLTSPPSAPGPPPGPGSGTCPVDPSKQCGGVPSTAVQTSACTCDCLSGWGGPDCSVCTSDSACQALSLGSRCNTSPLYGVNTTYKAYGCKLTSSSLAAYVQSDMAIRCDVSKRQCTILLDVLSDGQTAPVNCTGVGCTFSSGQGAFSCANIECGCGGQKVPCPLDLSQTVDTLTGRAKMTCADDSSGQCTLSLDALPSDLEATCSIGECTNSGNVTYQAPSGSHVDTVAVATSVPLSVLGLALLLCGAGFLRRRQRRLAEAEYLAWAENQDVVRTGLTSTVGQDSDSAYHAADEETATSTSNGASKGSSARSRFEEGVDVTRKPNQVDGVDFGAEQCRVGVPGRTVTVRDLSVTLQRKRWWDVLGTAVFGHKRWRRWREAEGSSRTHIINDVNFIAPPGEVLAVFGPSGGGKTTLLSVVAGVGGGSLGHVNTSGQVLVDGKERGRDYRLLASLLPQDDLLYGTLTACESIAYSAELRLPAFMPAAMKERRVDSTLALLGLSSVQHSRIGSLLGGRGLSGGERRRVRIGMELVSDCDILLMDEPTSGLDSHRALKLLQQLHAIARSGKTIILSVHQPSQEAFEQFDQILLLSATGRQMFCGHRAGLVRYFESIGKPCPPYRSFPDHMLAFVGEADGQDEAADVPVQSSPNRWLATDRQSDAREASETPIFARTDHDSSSDTETNKAKGSAKITNAENMLTSSSESDTTPQIHGSASANLEKHCISLRKPRRSPDMRRSFVIQLLVLYKRELINIARNPGLLLTHVVVSAVLGLLVGGVYYKVSGNLAGFQNRAGALYFAIIFLALSSASALVAFISERPIFISESAGRYYSPLAFFLPKVSLDWLLLRILPTFVFGTILYFLMGLRTDGGRFGVFLAVLFLVSMTSSSLCVLVSLAVSSVAVANVIALVIILIFLCFGGFLVNSGSIPQALRWLPKISFFTYAFEALMINELHGLTFTFRTVGIGPEVSLRGDSFLSQLNLRHDALGRDVGVLAGMVGIYILAAALLLHIRVRAVEEVKTRRQIAAGSVEP